METLDQTGRLLYDSYINARDAWIAYIRPIAIVKLNNYLSSTGRVYNKYEYYTIAYDLMKDKSVHQLNKPINKDIMAKYKKLCILFHPDKFIHPSSSELFCLLKKWFDSGNSSMLDMLDHISHFILEISTDDNPLTHLLVNLANPDILDIIKSKCPNKEDSRCLYDLLNTDPNKLTTCNESNNSSSNNMKTEDFINTNAYKFFMNETSYRSEIDLQILTEAEIINYIKEHGQYNDDFLNFYMERYRDNQNILQAIVEIQMMQNEKLKKENEDIRSRLNQLTEKKSS